MPYNPAVHHRRSIRLKGYDYTRPGAYFVTLVTWQRERLFGSIQDSAMILSQYGRIVSDCWQRLPASFPIQLDQWIIMPNHFHAIILIDPPRTGEASGYDNYKYFDLSLPDASPQRPIGTAPGSLGAILQNFKSISTRKINQARHTPGGVVWQRNYYEHIIRDIAEWSRIRQYIQDNPLHWEQDTHYA